MKAPLSTSDLDAWLRGDGTEPLSSEGPGDQWQDRDSPFCQHPTDHRLVPGGRDYWMRYAFVKGQVPRGATVLDVGCNCGQVIRNLSDDLGCRTWGIDVVADFIESCRERQRAQDISEWLVAEFGGLTPARLAELDMVDRFDAVLALEVIEHPLNMFDFRRNVAWALREGGRLVITTPHQAWGMDSLNYPRIVRVWSRNLLVQFFGMYDVYVELWGESGPHIGAAWTPTQIALQRWRCEAPQERHQRE